MQDVTWPTVGQSVQRRVLCINICHCACHVTWHTRVIQKIRRQRCCRAQNVFKKSNLTHGKIQNHIFYQQVMFQLIWLSSLHYIWLYNGMFLCHGASQRHKHSVIKVQVFVFSKGFPLCFIHEYAVQFISWKINFSWIFIFQRIVSMIWFLKHCQIICCLFLSEKSASLH
mgnify:CR=1 FL=1